MIDITKEELEEIIDDAWFDGYDKHGEYQASYRHTYIKEIINELVKKGKIKQETCPYCDGSGLDADDDDEGKTSPRRTCPQCKGTGEKKEE